MTKARNKACDLWCNPGSQSIILLIAGILYTFLFGYFFYRLGEKKIVKKKKDKNNFLMAKNKPIEAVILDKDFKIQDISKNENIEKKYRNPELR